MSTGLIPKREKSDTILRKTVQTSQDKASEIPSWFIPDLLDTPI